MKISELLSTLMNQISYRELPKHYRLRLARQCRFQTSKAFAESLGVANTNYSSHESGKRNFSNKTAKKYCNALGANFEWVTKGSGVCYNNPSLQGLIDELINQKKQDSPLFVRVNEALLTAILKQLATQPRKYTPHQQAVIIAKAYEEIMLLSTDENEQLKMVAPVMTPMLKFAGIFLKEP